MVLIFAYMTTNSMQQEASVGGSVSTGSTGATASASTNGGLSARGSIRQPCARRFSSTKDTRPSGPDSVHCIGSFIPQKFDG